MRRRGVLVGLLLAVLAGPEWLGGSMRAANDQQAQPPRTQPPSTDGKLNVIAFGAHPDDCDQGAGGVAAKLRRARTPRPLRRRSPTATRDIRRKAAVRSPSRRRAEAQEAGRRIGIDYVVLDNHDGELLPTLKPREEIIRQIRQWKADLVLAPRPNDYHPDHRYTGVLVQDAAYMVVVPNVAPDTPALQQEPCLHVLRGRLPEARTVPARRRGLHRRRDRKEDRHAGRARIADVRVAAMGRRRAGQRAEGRGRTTESG